MAAEALVQEVEICEVCGGDRWLDDPTACSDPDHCYPMYPCPNCNPDGDLE